MQDAVPDLLRAVFDALPAPTFLVDEDMRILLTNRAGATLARPAGGLPVLVRAGEALHCLESDPAGCGRGARCGDCVLRGAVGQAFASGAVHRSRAYMQRRIGEETSETYFLVSAAPLEHVGRRLAVLTLEDVTQVARLKSLLPMCAGCRKIRNDHDYWQSVEAYLKAELDVDVSHGFCEECAERLYPGLLARAASAAR